MSSIRFNQVRPIDNPSSPRSNYRSQGARRHNALRHREYAYAPAAFRHTELATTDFIHPEVARVASGHSLISPRDAEAVLGFRADVLSAIVMGNETFWLIDARKYVEPWIARGRHNIRHYQVDVTSQGRKQNTVDLGESGIALVQPSVYATLAHTNKAGYRPLRFEDSELRHGYVLDVGNNDRSSRSAFHLPDTFPGDGFRVMAEHANNLGSLEVVDLGSGAETEVLKPASPLVQFAGAIAMRASSPR